MVAADVAFKLADAKGAPVADAVVSLVSLDAPSKISPPAVPLEIMQKDKEFIPLVTPLVVGTAVNFSNRDTVQHQVYSSSKAKNFELPLYAGAAKEPIVFDTPGVVAVGCNIHDWMLAYVVVLETPLFAKSAADGTATIAAVSPGHYRAEVWQPRLEKFATLELTVAAETAPAPIALTLALKPDRRIHRAPAAHNGGYK